MKKFYLVFILTEAFTQFLIVDSIQSPPINRIDHLPTNLKPALYELDIHVYPNNVIPFRGDVRITVFCDTNTKTVILNVKDLKILDNSVTVGPPQYPLGHSIPIQSRVYVPLKDQYVITLTEELEAGENYEISMSFEKNSIVDLSDRGLIRYDYRKEPGQAKSGVTLTKTEINDARRYFPCLDQMDLKSNFRVRMTFPNQMTGLTSTVLQGHGLNTEGQAWGEFEESVSISIHSLSLIVANLKARRIKEQSTETTITIWTDSEDISTGIDFISDMSLDVFKFYLKYFLSYSPVSNLNILGLPKFHDTNTAKFGVILLDESTLSTSELLNDDKKADILLQLCYGISRQWIGASATMSEWNEEWVQRALATFLRTDCVNELITEKKSNPLDWHWAKAFINVLEADGESVSRPVHVDQEDFDLTEAFSDSLSADKAHVLIRMMGYFLGKDNFQEGMKAYYQEFKFDNSSLDQLWQSFNQVKVKNTDPHFGDTRTVKMIMDSWSRKTGYPLVTMTIIKKEENTFLALTQERFVQLEDEENATKTVRENDHWIIPLSHVTKAQLKNNPDQTEYPVELWLHNEPISLPYTSEWILLNLRMNVLCRVNYAPEMWDSLHETLMDENEYSIIDDLSRVQLIVDMFALAEVGKLPYKNLIKTMVYLRHEMSDLPLMAALHELNKIRSALYDSEVLKLYENYVRGILESIFERERFVKIDDLPSSRQEHELKKLVIESSCNFGVKSCTKQAEDLFKDYVTHDYSEEDNKIPKEIRNIVYCHGIKQGGKEEWDWLLRKYSKRFVEDINKPTLHALGCTKDPQALSIYLHRLVDDEFPPHYHQTVINGMASNEAGYKEMRNFFVNEVYFGTIKSLDGYENTIGFYLVKLFEYTNTEEDFNELKGTIDSVKQHLRGVENLLTESIRIAKRNFLWRAKHENTLLSLLEDEQELELADTDFIAIDDLSQHFWDIVDSEKGPRCVLAKVVTGNETWVSHFEHLLKQEKARQSNPPNSTIESTS